ncbi:MAG TPA: hypothetical protein VJ180_14690, partial [Pyrinomonadaceae bacterium]|nr:hypothetical protein [Pyrinomonadaceae bacterium]
MTTKRLLLFSLLLVAALALSACGTQVPVNNWPGLAADAERAYVASGSFVYAVNLNNGSEAWHYPAAADPNKLLFYATPVLTPDGQLLI